MYVLFVVHGMKNFQGENWPALKGFLENRRVNIPSSGKSLDYICALVCVLKEIFILLETVCVPGFIPTPRSPPRGSSTHTAKAYEWNWCFPGGTWLPWAGLAVFSRQCLMCLCVWR